MLFYSFSWRYRNFILFIFFLCISVFINYFLDSPTSSEISDKISDTTTGVGKSGAFYIFLVWAHAIWLTNQKFFLYFGFCILMLNLKVNEFNFLPDSHSEMYSYIPVCIFLIAWNWSRMVVILLC